MRGYNKFLILIIICIYSCLWAEEIKGSPIYYGVSEESLRSYGGIYKVLSGWRRKYSDLKGYSLALKGCYKKEDCFLVETDTDFKSAQSKTKIENNRHGLFDPLFQLCLIYDLIDATNKVNPKALRVKESADVYIFEIDYLLSPRFSQQFFIEKFNYNIIKCKWFMKKRLIAEYNFSYYKVRGLFFPSKVKAILYPLEQEKIDLLITFPMERVFKIYEKFPIKRKGLSLLRNLLLEEDTPDIREYILEYSNIQFKD